MCQLLETSSAERVCAGLWGRHDPTRRIHSLAHSPRAAPKTWSRPQATSNEAFSKRARAGDEPRGHLGIHWGCRHPRRGPRERRGGCEPCVLSKRPQTGPESLVREPGLHHGLYLWRIYSGWRPRVHCCDWAARRLSSPRTRYDNLSFQTNFPQYPWWLINNVK